MDRTVLKVEGMSCPHCENAIKKSLGALDGVAAVRVDLNDKIVTVEHESSKAPLDKIKNEIEDQGYNVSCIIKST